MKVFLPSVTHDSSKFHDYVLMFYLADILFIKRNSNGINSSAFLLKVLLEKGPPSTNVGHYSYLIFLIYGLCQLTWNFS